jgi:hypothetical protein
MVGITELIKEAIQSEIVKYIDAKNMLELFPSVDAGDITLETLAWRYLKDVAEASLTTRGWNPNRTRLEVQKLTTQLFSAGLEMTLEFMDWKIFEKMGVMDKGLDKIASKPAKQMTHYFFTGLRLTDEGKRAPAPRSTNHNFLVDPGTGSGTLTQPLLIDVTTAGGWGTAITNMILDIDNLIGAMVEFGFNKSNFLCFYPAVAEKVMIHAKDTGGSGLISPIKHLEESGISRDRIIAVDNIYMPTDPTGTPVAPAVTDFDIIMVDPAEVRVMYTERPFANVFTPNPGSAKPNLQIETGMTACPIFIPREVYDESKIYKGVGFIDGVSNA